jgi:drug/metabolite transporter (DMT)-like permease
MFRRLQQLDARMAAALFAVYIVWGSTYLAIKVVVQTMPPLLAAGSRFLISGLLLYGWARWRGEDRPEREQWPRLWLLGVLMFLVCYSCLFWAEKTVPSGIASVLVAMLPAWVLLLEVTVLKTQRLSWGLVGALAAGLCGVALLAGGWGDSGRAVPWIPCAAILVSEASWAARSILSKRFRMPSSHAISAGAQMICGGTLLLVYSAIGGEWSTRHFPSLTGIAALLYMIVFGSLIAYNSYVWLLKRMSPTRLASYAYVNPIVALAIGWIWGGEKLHASALAGSALVLASVFLILRWTSSGVEAAGNDDFAPATRLTRARSSLEA